MSTLSVSADPTDPRATPDSSAPVPPASGAETPAPDAAGLRRRVDAVLTEFLASQTPRLLAVSDDLAPVAEAVTEYVRNGGKRLRPAFAWWGWRGAGGAVDSDAAVRAAAALELLHACALMHDDVMDGSDTRRGAPSLHRRFEAMHRSRGWAGSAAGFGEGAAILVGDLALVWADELYESSGLPPQVLDRARPTWGTLRVELMAGQYLDLVEQAADRPSIDRALRVARYKTAKYTVEGPLHLGGALAGADDELLAGYSAFGLPLGEAFQLRDDVLGVFGDPAVTGKPAGDDLREGKRTLLIAETVARADDAALALLTAHLGDPDLDDAGVAALCDVITDCGALAAVEARISALTQEATDALSATALPADAHAALTALTDAATRRRS